LPRLKIALLLPSLKIAFLIAKIENRLFIAKVKNRLPYCQCERIFYVLAYTLSLELTFALEKLHNNYNTQCFGYGMI
jgi:hypothetical protein